MSLWASEISVTLFGEQCTLSGPGDPAALKAIHAISPEQVFPEALNSRVPKEALARARKGADRLRSAKSLPAILDHYREKTLKRLETQTVFL